MIVLNKEFVITKLGNVDVEMGFLEMIAVLLLKNVQINAVFLKELV